MSTSHGERKRTAVLVVHGMGSQRPLETVRGVVDAVWRDRQGQKVWFHPEPSGTDVDLTVQTTSSVPDSTDNRRVDFHELYWAHLIAETRAVAVLLWLFELARSGPRLKRGMKPLWWGGATYLVFLILSVTYLASQVIERLAQVETERQAMVITPVLTAFIVTALCAVWALRHLSLSIFWRALVVAVVSAAALALFRCLIGSGSDVIEAFATHGLPAAFSFVVAWLLMGKWAWWPFVIAYVISTAFHVLTPLVVVGSFDNVTLADLIPWSLTATWSSLAAWLFIGSYAVISALFLQPYLGDVARYLRNSPANVAGRRDIRRNAVQTLLMLHESGKYDRIVVVAHSLGTVVAYDMLRATFARMFRDIPVDQTKLGPEFERINEGKINRTAWRHEARVLMRKFYEMVEALRAAEPAPPIGAPTPEAGLKAWLVTDFVTVGSPLTHAHYLLCHGEKGLGGPVEHESELIEDFERRVREREFPTCRPKPNDGDKVLAYTLGSELHLHHAALFGLTRWTNLYFELDQVFWGDPIGGPVATYEKLDADGNAQRVELFGTDVVDVAVSTLPTGEATFFTHTHYWSVDRKNPPVRTPGDKDPDPPHIQALKLAVNLADLPRNEDPERFREILGVRLTN